MLIMFAQSDIKTAKEREWIKQSKKFNHSILYKDWDLVCLEFDTRLSSITFINFKHISHNHNDFNIKKLPQFKYNLKEKAFPNMEEWWILHSSRCYII